ncbi:MAG: hypothetical protein QM784_08080 [Polyangiaceae bacterium]
MADLLTHIDGQIYRAWQEERCPIVNGIFRPDDSVSRLTLEIDSVNRNFATLKLMERTTLSAIERTSEVEWTYLTQLCEFKSITSHYVAIGGEGGFGSDGFVALLERDLRLLWLAFFDWSNPFTKVSVEDAVVTATSSLDAIWRFPVDAPELVRVKEIK